MIGLKLALRNIVRMPKRTVINFILLLLVIASVTSGITVYNATGQALENLDENYVFVASMVSTEPLDYSAESYKRYGKEEQNYMTVYDFYNCFDSADILAYNVSFRDSLLHIPAEHWLFDFHEESEEEFDIITDCYLDCSVYPTNNLYLERGFFEGKFEMLSGGDFSDKAYRGGAYEIIIPERFAERHGIKVGDHICYHTDSSFYKNSSGMIGKYKARVAGIYTCTDKSYSVDKTCLYIPLQTFLRNGANDFSRFVAGSLSSRDLAIGRADFVLRGRDAIYSFAENAKKTGLDTNKTDIVFNNAGYDMIKDGLLNVRVVVVILVLIVSAAGVGILTTFTINMIIARRQEKEVLRAVGMKKSAVALMFMAELLIIAVLALPLGYVSGRLVSNAICRYADGTVEKDVAELELLNTSNTESDDLLLPLNCNIKISIADGTVEASGSNVQPYRSTEKGKEDHDVWLIPLYDTNAGNYSEAKTSEYSEITLAVTDDISNLIVEDHLNELLEENPLYSSRVFLYVPRSSEYVPGQKTLIRSVDYRSDLWSGRMNVQVIYCLICGYCDDSLGFSDTVFLTTTEEYAKTERNIYIENLPRCDMVIPTATEK